MGMMLLCLTSLALGTILFMAIGLIAEGRKDDSE